MISPRTVEAHRRNLLHKFGVGSAKELMRLSASYGEDEQAVSTSMAVDDRLRT